MLGVARRILGELRSRLSAVADRAALYALFMLGAFSLLTAIPRLQAAAAAPTSGVISGVWVATHRSLIRIDPADSQPRQVLPLPYDPSAVAVDDARGSIWVLSHKHLLRFDNQTSLTLELDLKSVAPDIEDPESVSLNPYDGSLWITARKSVLHLDSQGKLLVHWKASEKIVTLALALDETPWVLTKKTLTHFSAQGVVLQVLDLKGLPGKPRQLVVDSVGGSLWLAGKHTLLQLSFQGIARPPRIILPPQPEERDDDEDEAGLLALDQVSGSLAVATKQRLVLYDRLGNLFASLDLAAHGIHEPEALVFDPVSRHWWLGSHKSVVWIGPAGEVIAKISLPEELEAVGAASPIVLPTLVLLDPGNGIVTNNSVPPVRLRIGAKCGDSLCDLGRRYLDGFRFTATLNGRAVGNRFAIHDDVAIYQPEDRLVEGVNTLSVQATDIFGHASNTVVSEFIVDTTPPRFLTIAPPDNAVLTAQPVTIRGTLDDPTATVTLDSLASLGGKALPAPAGEFAFEVPLQAGSNTLSLLARDPAGNATTAILRLSLRSSPVTVTLPVSGAVVSTDRILVSGTFQGPANTGITVNGVPAETFGNRFYANNVPLNPGGNAITVVMSTMDSAPATQSVAVNSSAQSTVTVDRLPGQMATIQTVAGTGQAGDAGEGGPATAAVMYPWAIALDRQGGYYLLDNRRIRHISGNGIITTFAGGGQNTWLDGDGGLARQAQLRSPIAMGLGADGSLYVVDGNRVRRVDTNGIIRTVAGNIGPGSDGDGGPAAFAHFAHPQGIAVGADGALYIADTNNSCIRKVDPSGVVTAFAGVCGSSGYSGDGGPALQAQFFSPSALTLAPDGSLYVADSAVSVVRRIDPAGIISTIAGNGVWGNNGDSGPAIGASLGWPTSLTLGVDGSLYIADGDNSNIRRVSIGGTISTVAGTGQYGYAGDGGPPLEALFAWPSGIALDNNGVLFVADSENYRVRAFNALLPSGDPSPLLVAFRLGVNGITPARVDADFNGDGAIDLSTDDLGAVLQHRYPGPGVYPARFTVTDTAGRTHFAEYTVVLRDAIATDAMLRDVYTQMLARLRTGNIDSALNTITGGMREKYQNIFLALQPVLATVVDRLGTIQGGVIGDEMAEYPISRDVNGVRQGFLIYFLRSEDGVWRIDGM